MLWLQASTGGPMEHMPQGWPVERVQQMLVWILTPALDPTVGVLPGGEDPIS